MGTQIEILGLEDDRQSRCAHWCRCRRTTNRSLRENLLINDGVAKQPENIVFSNFFDIPEGFSNSLPIQSKPRDNPIHITNVRDLNEGHSSLKVPLESMCMSIPTKHEQESKRADDGNLPQSRSEPYIKWRDMDSTHTVGPTFSGYLQQSDIIVISATYTGDSYDTVVEVCRWLEEIKDTVPESSCNDSTSLVVFIWAEEKFRYQLRSFAQNVSSIKSYLGLQQSLHVTVAPSKVAEQAFLQTMEGVISNTMSVGVKLQLRPDNKAFYGSSIDFGRASDWEALQSYPTHMCYAPRAKKTSDMTFYKDLEPVTDFSFACFVGSILAAVTASWPWFVISWVRNKIILGFCDFLFSTSFCGTKPNRRCTLCCRLYCFGVARKRFCPLPAIRRKRSSWGKDKSFYAVSLYPMKPIKWISVGFFDATKRLLRRIARLGIPEDKQYLFADCSSRTLYGMIAAGFWYFFSYTLVTGVIVARVIVPLNDISGFPLKYLHYTVIYIIYIGVFSVCFGAWSSSRVKCTSYVLLKDSLPISLTYDPSDWSTVLSARSESAFSTELVRNYLRHISEERHKTAFRLSLVFAFLGLIVHMGIRMLLVLLDEKDGIMLYHFTDIPGVRFPFFLVVGLVYAGTLFLVCFVSLSPLLKQKAAMMYMSEMLETTPPAHRPEHEKEPEGINNPKPGQTEERMTSRAFKRGRGPRAESRSCARGCGCGSAGKAHLRRLSLHDPLNIHTWLHLRQCLLKEFQDTFAEAKYAIKTSIFLIVAALLVYVVEWLKTSSLTTNSTILTDALYWGFLIVFILYYASTMENENEKQLLLMAEAMSQIRRHQQTDFSGVNDDTDQQDNLSQSYHAYEASYRFMKEHPMVSTIFGLRLTRQTVRSAIVGVGGLAIPVLKAVMNAVS